MPWCSPRRSWQSSMIWPMWSFGARIEARTTGSRTSAMRAGSGMSVGLWTVRSLPSVSVSSNSTDGIVAIRSTSYSRSRRSRTMSMCRRPRKPQRKPKPSASEFSGSQNSAASLSESFSSASRSSSNWCDSIGNRPQNTIGLTSR